jgi:glycosyltransferase involved in cell wall biosynthesis
MKIVNSMFSSGLGGIEQAFIDYAESLALRGHEVFCVTKHGAKINSQLEVLSQKFPQKIVSKKIYNLGKWDPFAKIYLSVLLKKHKPAAIIAHGNRPSSLFKYGSVKNKIPMIGVVHNYWFKGVTKADFLFCVSADIRTKIITEWFGNDKVFKVPNLIRVGAEPNFKPRSEPPVIGVMARMVEKKGVDVFIKALSILNKKDIKFKAIIGGDGDLRNQYQTLRDELKLNDSVRFTGWVKDKEKFYNDMDIFCLPSLSEPFGIVLLEAMVRKKPIVSTNMEGPAEILKHNSDSILVDKGSPEKLAAGLEELLQNREKSMMLAERGFWVAKNVYDISVVAQTLEKAIEDALSRY